MQAIIFRRLRFVLLMLGCYLFSSVIYADTVKDEFSKLLNAVHSMQADFVQTVYDNRGVVVQRASGKMQLQRPGKFRWQIVKPIPQLIIASDHRLWIYDQDLEQVTIRSIKEAAGEAPALLLSHVDTKIEENFKIESMKTRDTAEHWFLLIPKSNDSMFASVRMGFSTQGQIREMQLKDHLGHTTRIQFNNAKINISLAASHFTFKPPANVDVIDETKKR